MLVTRIGLIQVFCRKFTDVNDLMNFEVMQRQGNEDAVMADLSSFGEAFEWRISEGDGALTMRFAEALEPL